MMKSRSVSFDTRSKGWPVWNARISSSSCAHADDLLGLDLDVDGLAGRTTVRLVDQHPGVREDEALARCPDASSTAAADAA